MRNTKHKQPPAASQVAVDFNDISLDFEMLRIPVIPSEPDDFSQAIQGRIFAQGENDRVAIGTLSASVIHISRALDENWNLYDILDAPSGEIADCLQLFAEVNYDTLTLDSYEYNEHVLKLFKNDVWAGDILLAEKIEIHPPYRGNDAGLIAMRGLINTFGGDCQLVVCKPFPLQYSCKVDAENQLGFKAALSKLKKYWKRAGFKRVPKTDLYALAPHWRLPRLAKA
jgi:hypothetical protein